MRPSSMHYVPFTWPFALALFTLFVAVVTLIELRILASAFERMGIHRRYVSGILLLSLLGSAINIPIAELPPEEITTDRLVDYFGVRYIVPVVQEWPRTIIAINVGGALIPIGLSILLMIKNSLYVRGMLAIAAVAVVAHWLAVPVRGVGISVPILLPPLMAAIVSLALAWKQAAPLAYIAGSLGILIGADLLNLDKIQGLGAPIASIGGAGTFDGVFMAGILAVLLSSVTGQSAHGQARKDDRISDELGISSRRTT